MHPSPLLPLHEAASARLGSRPEAPELASPLTYGDVPGEARAGVESALLLDAAERALVRITGSDAADFVHRITANDVRGLAVGQGHAGLLLTPKGKVSQAFELFRDAAGLDLVGAPGAGESLISALDAFLFTEDAVFEDLSRQAAPIELVGPRADEFAATVADSLPDAAYERVVTSFGEGPLVVTRTPVAGSLGLRLDAGPDRSEALWNALVDAGAVPGGFFARDSLRIEAGAALFGADVDDNVYPQEARWESAFSLTKGCYTGQEVIAKIDTYGGLNKCLVVLAVDGDDPVPRGARLVRTLDDEERDVGVVTSWSYSFALDRGIALAYAKRKHQAIGTTYRLGEGGPTATSIEFPVREHALTPTGAFEG